VQYKITHTTAYSYGQSVPMSHNMARLTPRETPRQTCTFHRLSIRPSASTTSRRWDYFGNQVHYFSIYEGHKKLSVTSTSRVKLRDAELANPYTTLPWEQVRDRLRVDRSPTWLQACGFAFESPRVELDAEVADYARPSFPLGRPILEGVIDLVGRIHADFPYMPESTTVHTRIRDVFALRGGVCQDLAHLTIGCLRSMGLAARYVSGYLRTQHNGDAPHLVGDVASHAWVSVYCGAEGWVDIDPTNNVLTQSDHVTLGWGRDYTDVCPIEGVLVGGGQSALRVSVTVEPMEG